MIDASVNTDEPPLRLRVDVARQAITEDHPEVRLKAAENAIFSISQGWVHQNTGNHLDGRIKEDGKWQDRRRKLVCLPTQRYDVPSG